MTAHTLALETTHGETVALQSVAVESTLTDLFAHTRLTQRFINTEDGPIEAVYTFPTPHGAVFLGLEVTIGEKTLKGVVMPDAKADRGYEEAIQDGDAAVLLREVEPGLYSVSVGNILPGEPITLTYTYAEQLSWQGKSLRLTIPTTIAPRYGSPSAIGLAAHELVEHAFGTGYALSLAINVMGELSACTVASPTHGIQTRSAASHVSVALAAGDTAMDRDFVLTLTATEAIHTRGVIAQNLTAAGEVRAQDAQWVADVGFYMPITESAQARDGLFHLIIDCSGSMGGDSIHQAKVAAQEIVDGLEPQERFNLTAFGSHPMTLFDDPMPITDDTLARARKFVSSLDANMGGTEIGDAIATACPRKSGKSERSNVLLITDGQVYDGEKVISHNRYRGHRIFTVGVGTAVSAAFLQELALETGGACELVAPNEHLAAHIVRHFGRMRQQKAVKVDIDWGQTPVWSALSDLRTVFAGDTVHVGAGFADVPEGPATLSVTYEDGSTAAVTAELARLDNAETANALPRVLAHQRLSQLTSDERISTALDYQLLTDGTKCLMTYQRPESEKAEELPTLRNVPHEQPAGWGGAGSVRFSPRELSKVPMASRRLKAPSIMGGGNFDILDDDIPFGPTTSESDSGDELYDVPAFLRRSDPVAEDPKPSATERLKNAVTNFFGGGNTHPLTSLALPDDLIAKLGSLKVHDIEDLLSIPKADWEDFLSLSDEEIALLLRALREAGYKAA